jgi:4,5-DOPA dioxygenase extradiol
MSSSRMPAVYLSHGAPTHQAPAARTAHPRTEHFAPLFVTLGAGENDLDRQRPVVEGFWGGLAKRSVQLG